MTNHPDLAAIRERVEALTIDPRFSAHYLYGFEKCRTAVLALLAATPSVEPGETTEQCKPHAHRYDRIGVEDRLRCRRCGWERYG